MKPGLKELARLVLPPILLNAQRTVRNQFAGSLLSKRPEWEAVPDSDALWRPQEGWAHTSIAETQRRKWRAFIAGVEGTGPLGRAHEASPEAEIDVGPHNTIITFGYVVGRVAAGHARTSVLDWGGGLGHYFVYARKLWPDLALDYVVKDLPGLCEIGRDVLPDVTFISDDDAALGRRYDLVMASSSLHYTRDVYALIPRLCAAASRWLMVTRSPFVDEHDDFVVVQRPHSYGYMTEYPGWFLNRKKFVEAVCSNGFALEREFVVAERPVVTNAPEQGQYRGFLFRRLAGSEQE